MEIDVQSVDVSRSLIADGEIGVDLRWRTLESRWIDSTSSAGCCLNAAEGRLAAEVAVGAGEMSRLPRADLRRFDLAARR